MPRSTTALQGSGPGANNDQERVSSFGPGTSNTEMVDEISDPVETSAINSALADIASIHEVFGLPLKDGGGNLNFDHLTGEQGEAGIQALANAVRAVNFDAISGSDQVEVLDGLQGSLNLWINQDPDGSLEWLGDQDEWVYRNVVNGYVSVSSSDQIDRAFGGLPETNDLVIVVSEIEGGESS
ncbi:MAG: hypothetical protein AAGA58_14770 [Verrucomicrobiota bacterium]